jgi:hypothetical protein
MGTVAWIPLNPPAPDTFARRTTWNASALLKMWHLASLDAPTVAVAWAWAFGWAAGVRPPAPPLVILGLVVWIIYVADRLMDARTGLAGGLAGASRHLLQARHSFHWRHRRILIPLCACAAAIAGWMVLTRMPPMRLRIDSVVGLATLAYLLKVHGASQGGSWIRRMTLPFSRQISRLVPRECVVGLVFSAGCLLPVMARTEIHWPLAASAIAFAALAWLNVGAIGSWESYSEKRSRMRRPAIALACACLALAAVLALTQPGSAEVVLAAGVSALLLAALDGMAATMEPVVLRAAADLVLLTPLLVLAARGLA